MTQQELAQVRAHPPTPDVAPYCRFPRWDTNDEVWVCCHGGVSCGGCYSNPDQCRVAPVDVVDVERLARALLSVPHGRRIAPYADDIAAAYEANR